MNCSDHMGLWACVMVLAALDLELQVIVSHLFWVLRTERLLAGTAASEEPSPQPLIEVLVSSSSLPLSTHLLILSFFPPFLFPFSLSLYFTLFLPSFALR